MPVAPRITLLTRVALPPETVFAMWVEPFHILRWWGGLDGKVLNASIDARIGGLFWIAVMLPEGQGVDDYGRITNLIPGEVLVADWNHGDRVSTLVVQLLALKDGRTEVTLTHRDFPDERTRNFQLTRWHEALTAFEAYAEELADLIRP
jgi:uncharacterized protein YndB with AHSA1/START domain